MANIPLFDPPADVAFAAPFWAAIEDSELRIPRCGVCGHWRWYPDEGGSCHSPDDLVWTLVPGTGTVYTFTRVQRAFLPGGSDQIPYTVAFLDMDETEGMRLVANVDDDTIAIGDRVRVTFRQLGTRKHPVFIRA